MLRVFNYNTLEKVKRLLFSCNLATVKKILKVWNPFMIPSLCCVDTKLKSFFTNDKAQQFLQKLIPLSVFLTVMFAFDSP